MLHYTPDDIDPAFPEVRAHLRHALAHENRRATDHPETDAPGVAIRVNHVNYTPFE